VYWGSTASPSRIAETRNVSIDLGADFVEDTVHADINRSEAPTFSRFNVTVTGLYDDAAYTVIDDSISKVEGYFYIYPKSSVNAQYWYGRGYISVDEASFPYDDFSNLNWAIRPSGTVTFKHA
jgi:hypothetical protein